MGNLPPFFVGQKVVTLVQSTPWDKMPVPKKGDIVTINECTQEYGNRWAVRLDEYRWQALKGDGKVISFYADWFAPAQENLSQQTNQSKELILQ